MLEKWIPKARRAHASDLHLEPGLPPAIRVRGRLSIVGDPVPAATLMRAARRVIPAAEWPAFQERRSFDAARVIAGVPCRLNVFRTSRGVGLAIRLLATAAPTLSALNLHPSLASLARRRHGLVLIAGPTGSGKSSTLAALVQTLNTERACHILTIEQPIEYHHTPQQAFIRQREVGRDTPSYEQALQDAMREDPDVIVVGEMRRPETMQLTLDAAETGHLVLATVHASTPAEAIGRLTSAFPSPQQPAVRAQLAGCLAAVVCQTLEYRASHRVRVPECAVLVASDAVRANVRDGHLHKLQGAMETGAEHGMWTRARYRRWLDERPVFHVPEPAIDAPAPSATPELVAVADVDEALPLEPTTSAPLEIGDDSAIADLIAELEGA